MTPSITPPMLSRGLGSLLHDQHGQGWTDLITGYGAVFLGHCEPKITAALQAQSTRLWAAGRLPVDHQPRVDRLINQLLASDMRQAGLLSTGMEAAEYAMRLAATHTGRQAFIAFERSMHGKSAMSAALCWPNAPLRPGGLHTLPFVDRCAESDILEQLLAVLRTGKIAALFVEPLQGSNGAHQASAAFYVQAIALCHEHGSLCIFDETLTGLYRTGPAFYAERLVGTPDMLIFAKSMGNGFPVACVALGMHIQITPQALPGSTFAGNPLALAVVEATLQRMAELPLTQQVQQLDEIARQTLAPLDPTQVFVRGQGALWCLELGASVNISTLAQTLHDHHLLVTITGRFMRLLPAATMNTTDWHQACELIAQACQAATS